MIPGVRVALGRSTESKIAALAEKATFGHRHPNAAVGVLGRTAVCLAVAVTYQIPSTKSPATYSDTSPPPCATRLASAA